MYKMTIESEKKHGAFTIIFSVWTSMVGTGAITIPWAFSNSGMVLGVSKLLSIEIYFSFKHRGFSCLLLHMLVDHQNSWKRH
jgi:amino acid permease